MKLECLFLGKTNEKYLAAGIDDFKNRLSRYCPVQLVVIKEKKGKMNDQTRIKDEGKLLLDRVKQGDFVVVLDRSGKQVSSDGLAAKVSAWQQQGRKKILFIIGGPLGLSKEVLDAANMVLSFSKMTFTHEMARMILLEQLYRAFSINSGSKYHK